MVRAFACRRPAGAGTSDYSLARVAGEAAASLRLLAAALLLALAGPAADSDAGQGLGDAAVAATVADWTAAASRLPRTKRVPVILRLPREEMARLLYGEAAAFGGLAVVEALYDRQRRRILLGADWDGASPRSLSVLVHEMVHHLEAETGLVAACPAAAEQRAYAVQDAFLHRFGSSLDIAFGIDPGTHWLLTHCRQRLRRG